MNHLQRVFEYNGNQVRTVVKDGEPWFVAKDVCEVLEIGNYRNAVARLSDKMKGVHTVDSHGGPQETLVVNEAGIYKLTFTSRKPEAERFTDWLAEAVLPSIRQTGTYSLIPKTYPEALRAYADEVERRQLAEAEVDKLKPKAEFFDAVADSRDAIQIGDAAKVLNCGIGRNRLFVFLREQSILMSTNVPYQEYIDRGYFRVIEQKWITPSGETRISIKTLVYQKGLNHIRNLLASKERGLALVGR